MKKNLLSIFFLFLMLSVACIFVSADASGVMTKVDEKGTTIVNNTWEYVESEKTLYIRSNALGAYNETGNISYDEENEEGNRAWEAYKKQIEHVILEGSFEKCTNYAFEGHTALKDIRITEETSQFDGSCFMNCTSLESITVGDNDHVPGVADLSPATSFAGGNNFINTKIEVVHILNEITTPSYSIFDTGVTICIPKNTEAFEAFSNTGRYTVRDNLPVEITVVVDGNTYTEKFPYGSDISFPTINDDCVVLYCDAEFKEPYRSTTAVENITLYGKPLLDFVGAMVRSEEYQGLRMIYSVDENALSSTVGFKIKEFGALAMNQTGIGEELDLSSSQTYKSVVYKDGKIQGKLLSIPANGITEYAYTAIGFEKDGSLSVENAQQNIYFRGYVVLVNPKTGEETVGYTKQTKMNLADGCSKTLNDELAGELSENEVAFIKEPLDKGAIPNYVYTKDELISVINTVYNDESHYMPAQHLPGTAKALSRFLNDAYDASGAYPALVSFDIENMTTVNEKTLSIIKQCKEYIEMGGIVSFSYHMENPTGNYPGTEQSRGELGNADVWSELIDETTELNSKFKNILSKAADVLYEFDKEGYPVLWRPLHEHNGDWFWWCVKQTVQNQWGYDTTITIDEEDFINLWKYVYNYYTNERGLKNLVWTYSPNVANSSTKAVTYGYPGTDYCDIVGTDWYTTSKTNISTMQSCYSDLITQISKPAAITEFGPSGTLLADSSTGQVQSELFSCSDQLAIVKQMMDNDLKVAYVLNWSGAWSMLVLGNMDVLMQDETALDLFEIKDIFDNAYELR